MWEQQRNAGRLAAKAKLQAEAARARALATKWNLPDLLPKEIHLALILATSPKPLTRESWLTQAGLSTSLGAGRTNGGRRIYIQTLETLGYIVRIRQNKPLTGARMPDLYLPSLKLLSAVADAAA